MDKSATTVAAWIGAIGAAATIVLSFLNYKLSARKVAVECVERDIDKMRAENSELKARILDLEARLVKMETTKEMLEGTVTRLEDQRVELLAENRELRKKAGRQRGDSDG